MSLSNLTLGHLEILGLCPTPSVACFESPCSSVTDSPFLDLIAPSLHLLKWAVSRIASSFRLSMLVKCTHPYSSWNLRNFFWMGKSLHWVKQICSPDTISNITNVQNWTLDNWLANKFSKISIFIATRFNLPQVCIYILPCLFIMSLIPSFNILNGYFDVSLNLVAVPSAQILMNFRTQLLYVTVS